MSSVRFGSVIFDCDSTLSAIEGIDELAHAHREEVSRLTEATMRGELLLEDVYGRRLALVRPTREQVHGLGERYVHALVTDARETIAALLAEGIEVRVLSGGKRTVLERWLPELPRPIMLVGDGATDLEARPPADRFVAFAGVIERPVVIDAADDVVRVPSLAPVLVLALGGVAPRDPRAREVFELGKALMRT